MLDNAEELLRAGHPQSLQNLDFGKQTSRPPLAKATEEEAGQTADQEAATPSEKLVHQQPARPQTAAGRSSPKGYKCCQSLTITHISKLCGFLHTVKMLHLFATMLDCCHCDYHIVQALLLSLCYYFAYHCEHVNDH